MYSTLSPKLEKLLRKADITSEQRAFLEEIWTALSEEKKKFGVSPMTHLIIYLAYSFLTSTMVAAIFYGNQLQPFVNIAIAIIWLYAPLAVVTSSTALIAATADSKKEHKSVELLEPRHIHVLKKSGPLLKLSSWLLYLSLTFGTIAAGNIVTGMLLVVETFIVYFVAKGLRNVVKGNLQHHAQNYFSNLKPVIEV